MATDKVIKNGTIVTAKSAFDAHVMINDGEITGITTGEAPPDGDRIIDASGKLVLPGIVDPHVHIDNEPENRAGTYEAETQAAAAGGVTTFIDFAFQGGNRSMSDPDADLLDGIAHKRAKQDDAYVDYSLHGVLHREMSASLEQIAPAIEEGISSFKMFLSNYKIGVSNGFVHSVLDEIAELDAVALLHTEDPSVCDSLTEKLKSKNNGEATYYPDSRPPYAEAMAADDVLRMVRETGAKYYGVHTTCRESADVIEAYQQELDNVRAETCTHYTALDRSIHERLGNLPKIAPPIRSPDDIRAMFEHLAKGTLSVVSTDHSVYHEEYKNVDNWWDSPFGANSLQYTLPIFYTEAVEKRGHSPSFLVELMSTNPAQTFGFPNKGTLDPGTDADIVVFDPNETWTIDEEENLSNSTYSIYDGRDVHGAVKQTFLRGELVAEDGEVVVDSPPGRFVEREIPNWKS